MRRTPRSDWKTTLGPGTMSDVVLEYSYDGDDQRLVRAIAEGEAFLCDGRPVHLPGARVAGSSLLVPLSTRILEVDLSAAKRAARHGSIVRLRLHFRRD